MKKRVGILTSGGDCPGLNATIRGAAKALYQRFGDEVEIVGPDLRPFSITVPLMEDEDGLPIEEPRNPQMVFRMQLPRPVPPCSIVRHAVDLSAK